VPTIVASNKNIIYKRSMYRHDIMNILGIFILLIFGIRPGESSCPGVTDGTCVACTVSAGCTDVNCDDGWLDSDNDATNGCETSNSTSLDYCATSRPSNITNCDIRADFTVMPSSFYSLQGQTPKLCYCTSVSTLDRYIIGENDKCFNGLPQYRDPNVLPPSSNATTPAPAPSPSSNATTPTPVVVNTTCVNAQCDFVICDDDGYYRSSDNVTCIQCEPGFFCPCDIFDSRKECESGTYQALAGQTSCDNCSGIVNGARTECSVGAAPSIANGICIAYSGTVCTMVSCDQGYYQSADNSTCVQCEPGYQCACDICDTREECPAGTFQPLAGQTSCDNCSGIVNAARTECSGAAAPSIANGTCITHLGTTCTMVICDQGYYRSADNSTCVQCEPGYQCACDICDTREECPAGTFQTLAGQTSCDACHYPRIVSADRSDCSGYCLSSPVANSNFDNSNTMQYSPYDTMNVQCDTGYHGGGTVTCQWNGVFSQTVSCSSCAAGYGYTTENSGVCEKCSDYSATTNATYNAAVGSISVCALQSCPVGQGVVNDNSLNTVQHQDCVNCTGNTYSDSDEHGQCKAVQPGYKMVTNTAGAHIGQEKIICATNERVVNNACAACPVGTTNALGDDASGANTDCDYTLCAANEHVVNHSCVACPAGTVNAANDTTSSANTDCDATLCGADEHVVNHNCVACPAGGFNAAGDDASGANTQCLCTSGKYKDANECKDCSAGKWSGVGSSECLTLVDVNITKCASGSYYTGSECTLCPAGKYQDEEHQYYCKLCPMNTYSPDSGNDDVTDCNACPSYNMNISNTSSIQATTVSNFGTDSVDNCRGGCALGQMCIGEFTFNDCIATMNDAGDILRCTEVEDEFDNGVWIKNYVSELHSYDIESDCSSDGKNGTKGRHSCEITCSMENHICASGFKKKNNFESIICKSGVCDTDTCCEQDIVPNIDNGICKEHYKTQCSKIGCEDEYYADGEGCAECPDGYTCANSVKTPCPAGSYFVDGQCQHCAPGQYQPNTGQTSCINCDVIVAENRTQCAKRCLTSTCPEGKRLQNDAYDIPCLDDECSESVCCEDDVLPNISNGICISTGQSHNCTFASCNLGYYHDEGACLECSPGYYCLDDISDKQIECQSGQYQPYAGKDECIACDGYVNVIRTTCTSIQTCDTYNCNSTNMRKKQAPDMCSESGCTDNICCEQDVAPTISNGICAQYDANTCLFANCNAGHYRSEDNSSCLACFYGTYQSQQGQATCLNAAVGHYVAGTAQTTQTACSSGTSQSQQGQASCDDCQPGQYQSQQGQATCLNATVGHYVAGTAQTTQTACSSGTSQSQQGQASCDDCAAGQYQSQQGQATCLNAAVGHYVAGTAQTTQTACSSGTSQSQQGQATCEDCAAGRYQSQQGQELCHDCAEGYCPQGATKPLSCPVGNYITAGRVNCVACAVGKFQSSPDQTSCVQCPTDKKTRLGVIGKYQDQTGQTECKLCYGTVSMPDRDACSAECSFEQKPYVCPDMYQEITNYNGKTCDSSECTRGECCREDSTRKQKVNSARDDVATRISGLFTAVVDTTRTVNTVAGDDASQLNQKENEVQDSMDIKQSGETEAEAVTRIWTNINDQVSAKMLERVDDVYVETEEERDENEIARKKKSRDEQNAEKETRAIDTFSSLNIEAAKVAAKAAEKAAEEEVAAAVGENEKTAAADAKAAAKQTVKVLAVTVRNVKRALKEQMKAMKQSVAQATEDDVAVLIPMKDAAVLNDEMDTYIKKAGVKFMKLKPAKDHSAVDFNDMENFNCVDADINLNEMGLYDFDEVFIDQNETAVACYTDHVVTYVTVTTDRSNDYNDYTVYCCDYVQTSNRRFRRQLSSDYDCVEKHKDAGNHTVKWNEHDTYTCTATEDYRHPVMSLGGTFTGCFLESNGTAGWVYDGPGRTLGDCGTSQCTVNNTNVTCLYFQESCQPACEAGYASDSQPLTCSGGNQYSTSETTCTVCPQNTYSTAGATNCTPCLPGEGAVALSSQCHNCAYGKYVASTTGCADCPSGKYVAATGQLKCHNVTQSNTNFVTLLGDNTGVECQYGGTPVYSADGAYVEGCYAPGIVMFGRAVIDDGNGNCANKCVKWYSTAAGNNLIDGFIDPRESGSTVIELEGDENTWYCSYLWGSTFNVPRSANC